MPIANEPIRPTDESLQHVPELTEIELNTFESLNVMAQAREATAGPSPLTGFLQDPVVQSTLSRPKKSHNEHRGSASLGSQRSTKSSNSLISLVLAQEENQAHRFKSLLRTTTDRLEHEIRRADQAQSRAEYAEMRALETASRTSAAEQARHQSEVELARLREEVRRYQLQLEVAERDLRRTQADVTALTGQRDKAEEDAARSRDTARKFQSALKDMEAREQGKEEGRKLSLEKMFREGRSEGWDAGREVGYNEGREEAWEVARSEGYEGGRLEGFEEAKRAGREEGRKIGREEGRKIGKEEGFELGKAEGRKEERLNAMQAFDRFLAAEVGEHDEDPRDRTQRWVESPYHIAYARPGSPPPRPVWLQRKVHGDTAAAR